MGIAGAIQCSSHKRNGDAGQIVAVKERALAHTGDTIRDSDAGQSFTEIERILANGGDILGDSNAGQTAAALKCPSTNTSDTTAEGYTGKIVAVGERIASNACYAVRNNNSGQFHITEGIVTNTSDAFFDNHFAIV